MVASTRFSRINPEARHEDNWQNGTRPELKLMGINAQLRNQSATGRQSQIAVREHHPGVRIAERVSAGQGVLLATRAPGRAEVFGWLSKSAPRRHWQKSPIGNRLMISDATPERSPAAFRNLHVWVRPSVELPLSPATAWQRCLVASGILKHQLSRETSNGILRLL